MQQAERYYKCSICKNLKLEKKNRSFVFCCSVFETSFESIVRNYEDYANCPFFIPKNFDGGGVLQPSIIFVGRKEISRYILATLKALETSSVLLKARGRLISKAVDVAELIKNRFLPGTEVKDVKINTVFRDGKRVSEIEILLAWGGRENAGREK